MKGRSIFSDMEPTKRHKERVKSHHTVAQVVELITENNMGATAVLQRILSERKADGYMIMLSLDSAGIYGSGIWALWKYVCEMDVEKFAQVLQKQQANEIKADVKLLADYGVTANGTAVADTIRAEMGRR